MKKVLVAGATGRVGQAVVADLVQRGLTVVAGGRKLDRLPQNPLVTPVEMDFHWSMAQLQQVVTPDLDAIIFTGGSRGQDLLQVDLNGAVKLMRAAQAQGVKRYVQLSAAYALDQAKWPDLDEAGLEDYYVAKYYSDRWLIDHPGLDYTIIQAGTLTTAPATGQVALNAPQVADNSIADVAAVLVATLDHPNTIGKVIMMQNGTTPIDPALAAVTTSAPVD